MLIQTADPPWRGNPLDVLDCVVVGRGARRVNYGNLSLALPAKVRRDRCRVWTRRFDSAQAYSAPRMVSGTELLAHFEAHLHAYRGLAIRADVGGIEVSDTLFSLSYEADIPRSRSVILATGLVNDRPSMPDAMHAAGLPRRLIHYYPICDGYEARKASIAVLGADDHGTAEALFLCNYGADVPSSHSPRWTCHVRTSRGWRRSAWTSTTKPSSE